jgi:hypothetical protein
MPIQMHSTISRSSNQDSFADVALIIPDFVTIFIHEDILEIIPNNKSGHLGPLHPGGSDHRSGTRWSPNNSAIAITITLVRDIDRCNTDSGHGLSSIIGSPISHGKRGIFLDKEYKILTSISTWDISAVLAICLCPSLQEPANGLQNEEEEAYKSCQHIHNDLRATLCLSHTSYNSCGPALLAICKSGDSASTMPAPRAAWARGG